LPGIVLRIQTRHFRPAVRTEPEKHRNHEIGLYLFSSGGGRSIEKAGGTVKQLIVVAGLARRNGRILMSQRNTGDSEGGKWEFPGGKVEPGEDLRAALKRELSEELGVDAEVGAVLEAVSVRKDDNQLVLVYFQCDLFQNEPVAIDCQQVRWFYPDEVDLLPKPEADRIFWERYIAKQVR
jgi:8-oxo-dGTP diphosphatase